MQLEPPLHPPVSLYPTANIPMSDRLQYHFADDVYSLQRTVNVDPNHSLSAGMASLDSEPITRKRGKFTRSKTGCLTCRTKKVKCDEEKPDCKRCRDTQRQCTWPEIVPTRKRPARKETRQSESPLEVRPSTAGSSGLSDVATPPPHPPSPPKQPLMPTHIHPSALAHQSTLSRSSLTQRHMSTPSISNTQRQQMMGNNSLTYALQPQGPGHASTATSVPTLPQQHHTAAPAPYPYRYSAQSQYVQQQQYPATFQGLSRVTTLPHDYASVKLEDTYDPPMKFEESADEWQASHLSQQQQQQHLDPIQPFFPVIQDRDYSAQYAQHYRYQ